MPQMSPTGRGCDRGAARESQGNTEQEVKVTLKEAENHLGHLSPFSALLFLSGLTIRSVLAMDGLCLRIAVRAHPQRRLSTGFRV